MGKKDYSKINFVKQVQKLYNYRGYKKIIIFCTMDVYMGYKDDEFFAFRLPSGSKKTFLAPKEAVDYYEDKIFIKSPQLDYKTFKPLKQYNWILESVNLVYGGDKKFGDTIRESQTETTTTTEEQDSVPA